MMGFRGFSPETQAELKAIQDQIDGIKSGHASQLRFEMIRRLERERDAIYQADYDLSRQHRG